jgi:hypothetical protein
MMMLLTVGVYGEIRWDDDDIPLKRTYVVEATDYGLQKMNELVNVQEPRLYRIGMTYHTYPCDACTGRAGQAPNALWAEINVS